MSLTQIFELTDDVLSLLVLSSGPSGSMSSEIEKNQ